MKKRERCIVCKKIKLCQQHHLFSQSKLNENLYPEFIHDKRNLGWICEDCHLWKPIPKYSEIEFCKIMNIIPRSKFGILTYKRLMEINNEKTEKK